MKLLLTSTGLSSKNVKKKFLLLFKKAFSNTKVLFIVSASETPKQQWYVNQSREELLKIGIKKNNFTTYHIGDKPSKNILDKINLIYVCGGNTFHLLEELRTSGLDKDIIKMVNNNVFYIGASAGSILASPTIEIARPWDYNDRNLKDLNGLNLIDFTIVPHYTDKEEIIVKKMEDRLRIEVKRITDDQAILVVDNKVEIID